RSATSEGTSRPTRTTSTTPQARRAAYATAKPANSTVSTTVPRVSGPASGRSRKLRPPGRCRQTRAAPDQIIRPGAAVVLVREGGVEPPRPLGHTDLNRARLPIPPLARVPGKISTVPRWPRNPAAPSRASVAWRVAPDRGPPLPRPFL